MPQNLERRFISKFLDIDHAGNKVSFRSRNVFLMYVSTTFVQWLSKEQSTHWFLVLSLIP